MNWKNLEISQNNIKTETDKSVLIKIPGSDFHFWHPSKLVRYAKGNRASFGYTDTFVFKAFKNGNGKWNKFEKIAEIEYSAQEIENLFGVKKEQV